MLKRLTDYLFARPYPPWYIRGQRRSCSATSSSQFNYAKEIRRRHRRLGGDGTVQWMQRAMPDARLVVTRADGNEIEHHPATSLIAAPNRYFGDVHLWAATVLLSYCRQRLLDQGQERCRQVSWCGQCLLDDDAEMAGRRQRVHLAL
ncbi:MAG: hypothetical protein R3D34_06780 [Nitratireductor sp.]